MSSFATSLSHLARSVANGSSSEAETSIKQARKQFLQEVRSEAGQWQVRARQSEIQQEVRSEAGQWQVRARQSEIQSQRRNKWSNGENL